MSDSGINYKAHTTGAKFHADNKSGVRVILGPVGGGKTVVCIMEVLRLSLAQEAYKGTRQTRWAIVRQCYDDQTEILTGTRGYQFFKDLVSADTVATLVGEQLVFQPFDKLYAAPYKGEMIGFENEGANFLVTPDHRMYVSKAQKGMTDYGPYHEKFAQDIYGTTQYRVKRDAKWQGIVTDLNLDQYEWLGYWYAEGSSGTYAGRDRCTITSVHDLEYCRDLFDRAGVKYFENKRPEGGINFIVHQTCEIYQKLKKYLINKAHTKTIPQEIKDAELDSLDSFLVGYSMGDGHTRKEGTETLYTSSKLLADDLQEIALKAGLVANIAERDRRGKVLQVGNATGVVNHKEYIVTILNAKKNQPKLYVNPKMTTRSRGWYKQDYDGMVYCVEMPLVPVYVRRKGKAFWCYRTYPELKNTTLKTWKEWIPEELCHVNMQPPYSGYIKQLLPDGTRVEAEVIFLALDQAEDVRKLKSIEFTGIFINEVRYCDETVFITCKERIGRFPAMKPEDGFNGATWHGIFADTNAWSTTHWLYEMFDKGADSIPAGHTLYTQPPAIFWVDEGKGQGHWEVNPDAENLRYLKPDYYSRQLIGGKDDLLRVELGLERGMSRMGKPVFPQFSEKVHVAPKTLEAKRGLPIVLGFDWGLNPACVFAQFLPGGILQILEMLSPADESLEDFCDTYVLPLLNRKYAGFKIQAVGDPAGRGRSGIDKRTPYIILNERGIHCKPAMTNSFIPRKEAVDWFLDRHKLIISPELTTLREGFSSGYHYAEMQGQNSKGMFKEVPVKNEYSHSMDAIQYIALFIKYSSSGSVRPSDTPKKKFQYA